MRTTFRGETLPDLAELRRQFDDVATTFRMEWNIFTADRKCKTLLAVSKQGHCLNSLLHRWSIGTLPIEITGVVSNHDTHRRLTEWYGLAFHHYPIEEGRKLDQEARILQLFETTRSDLLVLARYMQVLSDDACRSLSGRCINIHHSFLPGFKGAKRITRRMRAASRSSARRRTMRRATSTKVRSSSRTSSAWTTRCCRTTLSRSVTTSRPSC
jgi:formyltetrahydrofolate deformylase